MKPSLLAAGVLLAALLFFLGGAVPAEADGVQQSAVSPTSVSAVMSHVSSILSSVDISSPSLEGEKGPVTWLPFPSGDRDRSRIFMDAPNTPLVFFSFRRIASKDYMAIKVAMPGKEIWDSEPLRVYSRSDGQLEEIWAGERTDWFLDFVGLDLDRPGILLFDGPGGSGSHLYLKFYYYPHGMGKWVDRWFDDWWRVREFRYDGASQKFFLDTNEEGVVKSREYEFQQIFPMSKGPRYSKVKWGTEARPILTAAEAAACMEKGMKSWMIQPLVQPEEAALRAHSVDPDPRTVLFSLQSLKDHFVPPYFDSSAHIYKESGWPGRKQYYLREWVEHKGFSQGGAKADAIFVQYEGAGVTVLYCEDQWKTIYAFRDQDGGSDVLVGDSLLEKAKSAILSLMKYRPSPQQEWEWDTEILESGLGGEWILGGARQIGMDGQDSPHYLFLTDGRFIRIDVSGFALDYFGNVSYRPFMRDRPSPGDAGWASLMEQRRLFDTGGKPDFKTLEDLVWSDSPSLAVRATYLLFLCESGPAFYFETLAKHPEGFPSGLPPYSYLGGLKPSDASALTPPALELLRSSNPAHQLLAAYVLGVIKAAGHDDDLIAAFQKAEIYEVKRRMLGLLAKCGQAKALALLAEVKDNDPSPRLRKAAEREMKARVPSQP